MAADCCTTESPCGGEKAGRSPVDRGKKGAKRSVAVDADGIPLGSASAPANRHDSPLLVPTPKAARSSGLLPEGARAHLDRAYDSKPTRERLRGPGLVAEVSRRGTPAPLNATYRQVTERTNSRQNARKELLRCTERRARVVDSWMALSEAVGTVVVVGRLVGEGWKRHRWEGRPSRCP